MCSRILGRSRSGSLLDTLTLVLLVAPIGCHITDEDLKLPYAGFAPQPLNDGWRVSTPEAEGFDRQMLEQVYVDLFSEAKYPTAHSLLVVRNGALVAEAYARDQSDRDRYHNIQSAAKSVTSILTGIAADQGLIGSVNTPVFEFIPSAFDGDLRKRQITLFHALTMQTGLQFDNDEDTSEFYHSSGSSLEFVLHRDLGFTPGSAYYYQDGNPQIVSGVLQQVTGMTLEQYAARYLFTPLGIVDYLWESHADGLSFGAFGLWLRPRDMAKLGLMLAQDGAWDGEQVVSSEWIEEATAPQTQDGSYGYYFWPLPGGAYRAEGHGGQIIQVVPSADLVLVMTADPYSASAVLSPGMYGLLDRVVGAVVD